MAYTLLIEDILPYACCGRRYLLEQSLLFIESNAERGLPCRVKAKIGGEISFIGGEKITIGGRNIYEYDPRHVANWLRSRKEKYKAEQKNFRDAERLIDEFSKEMEDIARGS
jgi:hypothetical protein